MADSYTCVLGYMKQEKIWWFFLNINIFIYKIYNYEKNYIRNITRRKK
jgi:hypothetical protein